MSSDSEVDLVASVLPPPPQEEGLPLAIVPVGDQLPASAVAAVEADAAPRPARSKRKWPGMPGPKRRTAEQHAAMGRVLAEARARHRALRAASAAAASSSGTSGVVAATASNAIVACSGEEQTEREVLGDSGRSVRDRLCIAFASSSTVSGIAREYTCSRHYVRDAIQSAAAAWEWSVRVALTQLQASIQRESIVAFWDHMKFDDTTQRLSISVHDLLSRDQLQAGWCIMVSCREVGVLLADGSSIVLPLPQQPVVLIGAKTAGCLWDALCSRRSATMLTIYKFISDMQQRARIALRVRESDGLGTCAKVCHTEGLQQPGALSTLMVCGLHQNSMVVAAVAQFHHPRTVAAQYCHAALLRMGDMWTRTVLAAKDIARSCILVRHRPPGCQLSAMMDCSVTLIVCVVEVFDSMCDRL